MKSQGKRITLLWMCKTDNGWKRYPAAIGKNGRIRPNHAQVGDRQIAYPVGHYELSYYNERKKVFRNVGTDAALALAAQQTEIKQSALRHAASEAGIAVAEAPMRIRLRSKADAYITRQIARNKIRSSETFTHVIAEFLPIAKVEYADQLTEDVILKWYVHLRKNGNQASTINNKHVALFAFLNWAGVDIKPLAPQGPPSFTRKEVSVYTTDELTKFFAAMKNPYHKIVFEVLLKAGLRMQEAMHLGWEHIDFVKKKIKVRERDDLGFEIKDRAERTVKVSTSLIDSLTAWKESGTRPGRLVLGTCNDTPNWKWLPMLKRIVRNAGMNCGLCKACNETGECERWTLKKFRSTFTTNCFRAGYDPKTVMTWTGHSDLATVLLYMAPAEDSETDDRMDRIIWTQST